MSIRRVLFLAAIGFMLAADRSDAAPEAGLSGDPIFSFLNLSDPGLMRVRILHERGDLAGAKKALSEHFVQRRVRVGFWPPDPRSPQNPDDLVKHRFTFYGSQPFDAGTPIRWNGTFLEDRELTYALNRHQHFATLAAAYRARKDPKYAAAFVEQLRDWIEHNPKQGGQTWAAWRNLEVAVRLGVWSDLFFAFLPAPEFTPDAQALMLASLHEQAEWLTPQVNEGRGDWSVSLATGLASVAVMFPEFKKSETWRKQAFDSLIKDLREQVYPDGAHESLSLHRHNAVLTSFWLPLKLAVENRVELPAGYRETLERMAAYQAYIRRPDGKHPAFNASDAEDLRVLLTAAARFFGRRDIDYILTRGASGTPPTSTSAAFAYSGVYVMRDGWGADANYLAIDAGPYGTAYQHEDKLSFELAAFGRTVLVDPGRHSLDIDDPLTQYLEKTAAHNTVMIDGHGQQRANEMAQWDSDGNPPNEWLSRPEFDYFAGKYTAGYAEGDVDVRHYRRVLFVKDKQRPYWIVSDRVDGPGRHSISPRFQFAPTELERLGPLAVATKSTDTRLAIVPPKSAEANWSAKVLTGSLDPFGGWVSFQYRQATPAPQLIYDFATSLPAAMEYALVPMRGDMRPPVVTAWPASADGSIDATALELDFGDLKDTIFIRHDRNAEERTVAGVKSSGWLVVVRTPKGGQPRVLIEAQ